MNFYPVKIKHDKVIKPVIGERKEKEHTYTNNIRQIIIINNCNTYRTILMMYEMTHPYKKNATNNSLK